MKECFYCKNPVKEGEAHTLIVNNQRSAIHKNCIEKITSDKSLKKEYKDNYLVLKDKKSDRVRWEVLIGDSDKSAFENLEEKGVALDIKEREIEEVQKYLRKKGIEMSDGQVEKVLDYISEIDEKRGGSIDYSKMLIAVLDHIQGAQEED